MDIKYTDPDIKKILDFAEFMGISGINLVKNMNQEALLPDNPAYCRTDQTIKLVNDMSEEKTKYSLLHELGHYREDILYRFQTFWHTHQGVRPMSQSLEHIVEEEISAWRNGEYIAKLLNIKLGANYKKFKKACLLTYQDDYLERTKKRTDPLRD